MPTKYDLTIKLSDLKPKIKKGIIGGEGTGLYYLEKVFGIGCDGHGCGFEGEDISFTIDGIYTSIFLTSRSLKIDMVKYDPKINDGYDEIPLTKVEKERMIKYMAKKLVKKETKNE